MSDRRKQLESRFQKNLIAELHEMLPGALIYKNETVQGIPDLTILYRNKWASLEVKKSARAARRPNQEHYVQKMNDMSFSRFIYPENREEVLSELQQAFEP